MKHSFYFTYTLFQQIYTREIKLQMLKRSIHFTFILSHARYADSLTQEKPEKMCCQTSFKLIRATHLTVAILVKFYSANVPISQKS